jgi:hypothetical protein
MLTFYLICGVGSSVLFGGVQSYQLQELDERRQTFLAEPTPDALHLFVVNSVPGGFEYWVKSEQVYDFVNKDFAENPQNPEYIALGRKMVNEVADFFIDGRSLRGASGAVFGIFMAMLLLFPNLEVQLLFPPIPIKIKYLVTIYTVYEIYYLIQNNPADNVAHLAHLGGMLFAFFLIRRWGIPQQF